MSEAEPTQASARERLARPALALGAGALVAFSLPPWGFWPLAFVGVALFEIALGTQPSLRQRAVLGWLFGAGWMFLGMGWMIQLTGPGYVVAGAMYAGYHAAAAMIAPIGAWRVIGRPAAHALAEALRFSFPFGGVPLASMGISQVGGPFAGVARVGGAILLTWLVFQLGSLLSRFRRLRHVAGQTPRMTRSAQAALGAGVLTLAVVLVSIAAPSGSFTGEQLRIAAVQGGGEQGTRALDVPSIEVTERHLEATETIQPDDDLDLVFWPENAIDVTSYDESDIAPLIAEQAARLGVPMSIGLTEDAIVDGRRRYTNAQVIVNPDGSITSRYDKVRRVPFGEYVPLRSILESVTSAVDQVGDAVPGETPAYLDLPTGERMATVISWEIFFGGRTREGVALGAEVVLNPTNGASYTGTIVQTQQIASSRLRAIETGRWVVQAAPTGFTAVIDSNGNVIERTAQREQRVIIHDVDLRTGNTWYVSLGDRPFIGALLALLIAAAVLGRRTTPRDDDTNFGGAALPVSEATAQR